MPGILRMPSLAGNSDIQPGPLKKTRRLTTQDISKTLALKDDVRENDSFIPVRDGRRNILLVGSVAL